MLRLGEKEKENCLAKMRCRKYNSQENIEKANNCFENNTKTQLLSSVVDLDSVQEIKYFQAN